MLFTIGHSNHSIERFLELLARHQIDVVVDVRRFPGSRAHPHFNRENLEAALAAKAVGYEWIEELGGRRKVSETTASPNQGLRNDSFRNFADYMRTPEFGREIDKLMALAARRSAAIMCAEGLWWRCHRRLVSDYLLANGIAVEHIFPNGATKPHAMTPEAKNVAGRISYPGPPTLFEGDQSFL